jgi:hypothetical protein
VCGISNLADHARRILYFHGRPESIVFHETEEADYYLRESDLRMSEAERKVLYLSILRAANKEIAKRTFYGIRTEPLPDHPHFTVLMWFNAPEEWSVIGSKGMEASLRGDTHIDLDANEVVVPFPIYFVKDVAGFLDPLPLYELSFEAKMRGRYPKPTPQNVRKALKGMADTYLPDVDNEERQLWAMEMFDMLVRAKQGDPDAIASTATFLKGMRELPFGLPYLRLLEQFMEEA